MYEIKKESENEDTLFVVSKYSIMTDNIEYTMKLITDSKMKLTIACVEVNNVAVKAFIVDNETIALSKFKRMAKSKYYI